MVSEFNAKKATVIGAAVLPAGIGIVMGMRMTRVFGLGLTGLGAGCLLVTAAHIAEGQSE